MWEVADSLGHPDAGQRVGKARFLNPDAALRSNLNLAFGDLRMLAETMGQHDCVKRIARFQTTYRDKLGKVFFDHESDDTYSLALDQAKNFLESLVVLSHDAATEDPYPFECIVRNTAKIIRQEQLSPSNETGVKDAVFRVLNLAYPDAKRKQPVPHPIKDYVPDFASKAAQALAEYKFASNHAQLKVACDHLKKSMLGYSGYDTWVRKFGVIYLTSSFASDVDVKAHFNSVGMPKLFPDWQIILLNGKGANAQKQKKPATGKTMKRQKSPSKIRRGSAKSHEK